MPHAMCITGIVSGLLIAAIFLLNAISGLPFGRLETLTLDIGFIVGGLMVSFLGWSALKETK